MSLFDLSAFVFEYVHDDLVLSLNYFWEQYNETEISQ